MSKPLVRFGDPERAVIDYYAAAYAGAIAASAPSKIDSAAPPAALSTGWWLQVELDGTPDGSGWVESPTVRVNCHTPPGKRSDAKANASLAHGLLRIHPGDDLVFGTVPLVGRSQVITDPATKNLMVWFTFRVNLRPTPVSV